MVLGRRSSQKRTIFGRHLCFAILQFQIYCLSMPDVPDILLGWGVNSRC